MNRNLLGALALGLALASSAAYAQDSETAQQSPGATAPATPSMTPDPNQPKRDTVPGDGLSRETRIRLHSERIEGIIAANRARKAAMGDQSVPSEIKPGWVVRVAERIPLNDRERLERQLKQDGFEAMVISVKQLPSEVVELKPALYDVVVHFGDNQADAMSAEKKLRGLGYRFDSIKSGRLVDQIPENGKQATTKTANANSTITQ